IKSLARTLFFSGSIVSIYGIMQYVGLDPIRWGSLPFEPNRAFSTYGNPDLLGGFLVFSLVISFALAMAEEDSTWRAVYWTGTVLGVLAWIVAFTRGAWIGGTLGLAIVVFAMVRSKSKPVSVDYWFLGAAGVLGGIITVRSLTAASEVMNVWKRFSSILNVKDQSAVTRFQIWQAAIDAIKERPIFGYGADTFRLVFPRFKPADYVEKAGYLSVADNVHNYPLQTMSALGIPGFLLLYGVFAVVLWLSAPIVFAKEKSPDRLLMVGFWAAAVGYLVQLFFGIAVTGSGFLLWVSMAIVLSPLAKTVQIKAPAWGVAVAATAVVLVCALLVGNVIYVVADNHYLQARVFERDARRIEEVRAAIRLNPYNDMYRAELGVAYADLTVAYISQASNLAEKGDTAGADQAGKTAQALLDQAETAFKDVIEFVPWEYDNYVFLSNLYNMAGDFYGGEYYAKAVDISRRGADVERYGPAVRMQLARGLVGQDKLTEAQKELEYAVGLDSRYIEAWSLLGQVRLTLGDNAGAKEAFGQVARLRPEDTKVQDFLKQLDSSQTTPPE
ncbi:MAG: O-antigen ligase family protein, partial [Coriobacteriia bacterium]|nr:O-antigen ligase family protein [Coriobacteriia bacterium]